MLTLLFLFLLFLILCYIGVYCLLNLKEGFISPSRVAEIVEKRLDMDQSSANNDDSICQTKCGSGSWCKQDKHCHGCEDIACGTQPDPGPSPTPSPTPTPSPSPSKDGKGILFLYPESGGFNVDDREGFPDAKTVANNFHTLCVIGNHAGGFQKQWLNQEVLKLVQDAKLINPDFKMTKWLAYYFGKDSALFSICNSVNCSGPGTPEYKDCMNKLNEQVMKDKQAYQIDGIMFDDEEGDTICIAPAMEYAALQNNVKLGWTKSLGSAKMCRPRQPPLPKPQQGLKPCDKGVVGNMPWDYCFGQAYTDTTLDLYSGSCNFADNNGFWEGVKLKYGANIDPTNLTSQVSAERGVPMVCGAGDCQEVPEKKPVGNSTSICYDERMSGKKISDLINSRPPPSQFPWRNFAIWYGTYPGTISNKKWGYQCTFEGSGDPSTSCLPGWNFSKIPTIHINTASIMHST
jgi:hypothetical protein